MSDWKIRLKAAAVHLGLSLLVATGAALLVFGLWYPAPYDQLSGGRELFFLIVSVDVVLGPLITFAVFNRTKPKTELIRDLAIVGLIQLAGLSYGLWTVSLARPVHLVFEVDRFRVVHVVDIAPEALNKTPTGITAMPLTGPTLLAVRPLNFGAERLELASAELRGEMVSARPDLWQPYEQAQARVLAAGKPVATLKNRYPARAAEIDRAVAATGRPIDQLRSLPLSARKLDWSVLVDARTAQVVGFLPLDSF